MDKKILFTQEDIQQSILNLKNQIENDNNDNIPLVFICLLNGAFMFFTDLVKSLDLEMEVDFIRVKSYMGKKQGDLVITKDIETKILGKRVFIVDDLVDSGNTFKAVIPFLEIKKPIEIKSVALIKKSTTSFIPDYYGLEMGDEWIFGYGMDLNGKSRNLPEVYKL